MSNYYAPYFYRIDFTVIPSYIELPWFKTYFQEMEKMLPMEGIFEILAQKGFH